MSRRRRVTSSKSECFVPTLRLSHLFCDEIYLTVSNIFLRFECFCVLDLGGLAASQLSKRALTIVKEQAAIDSLCFPETMSKMLIVNAPTFFSATWGIIKGWLDPRTAAKIEVISNRKKMEARLLEYIDADQVPSDYGGTGADSTSTMMECMIGDIHRMSTKMLYLR